MRGEERMRQVTIRVDPDLWAWVEATVMADQTRRTTQSSLVRDALEAYRKAPPSGKAPTAPLPTGDPASLLVEATDALKTVQRVVRQMAKQIEPTFTRD